MDSAKLAPGYLVAAPQLRDPNFDGAVILVIEHDDDEGSLGLIINRPSNVDLGTVIEEMRLSSDKTVDLSDHPLIMAGGPVALERGWILHTPDWSGPDTRTVHDDLCVTSSLEILHAIIAGEGPKKYRFYLGYSGWGAGQLISEIKVGAWITVPFSVDLVFDVPAEKAWDEALSRLGISASQLVPMVGDA